MSLFPKVPTMVVHVQDLNVTDSAESLTHQEPDGNVLDTSAGEEQECLCSEHAAKPEVLSPQGSIPQTRLHRAAATQQEDIVAQSLGWAILFLQSRDSPLRCRQRECGVHAVSLDVSHSWCQEVAPLLARDTKEQL